MYIDLCQFELAKKFMKGQTTVSNEGEKVEEKGDKMVKMTERDLKVKEADWARSTNDSTKAW